MSRSGIRPHAGVRPPSLLLAALGVVFGDIGTSPLYAFREAFAGNAPLPMAQLNVFAVLSMILWSLLIIVSLKYVLVMLRFDHEGEGGVLALMSYTLKRLPSRAAWPVTMLGLAGAGLFYGDAMITPAISVLAAVEGIAVAAPALEHWIVPVALIVLIGLFAIQPHGTASVGRLFGPVMVAWFVVLAALGLASIVQTPHVLLAADPRYAAYFAIEHPGLAMLALTAVFLCLTGAEALYADLGHFGRSPIRRAWFLIAFPALIVNYFGQGALVLRDPSAAASPFYLLAPAPLVIPLIVLATAATVIASQAVISAAFSVSQQASRLNCLPRLQVRHTSDLTQGQIFVPAINRALLVAVVLLVLAFRSSANLAGAYGVAVSAVLLIGTMLLAIALIGQRGSRLQWLLPLLAVFALLEIAFLVANLAKIADGGWVAIVIAAAAFAVMSTWRRGVAVLRAKKELLPRTADDGMSLDLAAVARVPGAAVFLSSSPGGYPTSFLHNLKHNKVMHEKTVFMTVSFDDVPRVLPDERVELQRRTDGIVRLTVHFGFREDPDIRQVLLLARRKGLELDVEQTSFFTSKPVLVSVTRRGAFGWRRTLFGWMLQNSPSVAGYLRLPPNRVVELGTRVLV